jgi:N-acetylglucosamine kinase-like BadF-type ATPase
MMLIADSGSTRTRWCILKNNNTAQLVETAGLNPYFTGSDEIQNIVSKEINTYIDFHNVNEIHFYGAGCKAYENSRIVSDALSELFHNADIEVNTDILGAARGLLQRETGIACILGTGSNTCFYDGRFVTQRSPSLGYILGDEGSAADIGKRLLRAYLYGSFCKELKTEFEKTYPYDIDLFLKLIYHREHPNRFLASLSRFAHAHSHDPLVSDILNASFSEYFERHLMIYPDIQKLPVAFTGSISFFFESFIRPIAQSKGVKINSVIREPMDGLIQFHSPAATSQ